MTIPPKYVLAIETSCDETACAIVEDGVKEISSVLATSSELHKKTGGVVPEVAARKQVEFIVPVISETLEKAVPVLGIESTEDVVNKLDAIAVTMGPGLIGSLVVGVEAAKALSLAWNKPLIPVNHLVGHIYGNFLWQPNEPVKNIQFSGVVLIVSGGHTDLVLMKNHGELEYLGGTLDDAAGEAFDKTARLLGLSKYLGGAELSKKASLCKENIIRGHLPRPMIHEANFDFSFSGLKTAVRRLIEKDLYSVDVVACEFENAVVDVLVSKTIKAAKKFNAKSILLAGGVAANKSLRSRLAFAAKNLGIPVYVPPINLCTDNAVYIASAAFFVGTTRELEIVKANPSLGIMDNI